MKKLLCLLLTAALVLTMGTALAEGEELSPELVGHWYGEGTNANGSPCTMDLTLEADGSGLFALTIGPIFFEEYPIVLDVGTNGFSLSPEAVGTISSVDGMYTLEEGILHVEYSAVVEGFTYSYVFDCERVGILPDIEWMGHTLRIDELRDTVPSDGLANAPEPKGRYVTVKFMDKGDGIPKDEIAEDNAKLIKLLDENGEETMLYAWSVWGVSFDAAGFAILDIQEGFRLIYDVPADGDLSLYSVICTD